MLDATAEHQRALKENISMGKYFSRDGERVSGHAGASLQRWMPPGQAVSFGEGGSSPPGQTDSCWPSAAQLSSKASRRGKVDWERLWSCALKGTNLSWVSTFCSICEYTLISLVCECVCLLLWMNTFQPPPPVCCLLPSSTCYLLFMPPHRAPFTVILRGEGWLMHAKQ